ncbi:MAG: aminotransferase class I/II-fold pyridoxal phosphate-dependent enzyme [Acidobacteriia bacterium]|nr:aminotransferase class I/II-fold pyridoxal phosphate-dependent enzyme [Terriglobia bacterium]
MQNQATVSRRGFITGTTLGVASLGLNWPGLLTAGERGLFPEAAEVPAAPIRLNRNESPYGLAATSIQAIQNAIISQSPRYPFEEPAKLAEALADRNGVSKDHVLLGCGSIEILKMATETFCSATRSAVVAEPTFEAVVSYCPLAHATPVKIDLTKEYQHDLPKMLAAAKQSGGLIFFCNPSNPAGTYIGKRETEEFVRQVPAGVTLLVDEAYFEYIDRPDYESCVRYVREGLPIIVSRTFSKVYGMAGLRVGYAIGHPDLIKQMSHHRLANNPNQLATTAALAALKDETHVHRIRRRNQEVRESLFQDLHRMELKFIPSETNFVMVDLGRPAGPVIKALEQRQVLVGRLFPSMPNHMRVTLGTPDEMKVFVREFKGVMKA